MKTFKQFYESHEWMASNDMQIRAADLKQLIDDGETPDVYVASFVRGRYTFDDLRKIGYARKHQERRGRTSGEEWWEYTGPKRIAAMSSMSAPGPDGVYRLKEIRTYMKDGDTTPPVEVEYG